MSKINELGDLGDRMMQGLPYGQGGAIAGAVEPGVLDTFGSPDVVQDPSKFGSLLNKSNLTAKQTQATISPMSPYTGKSPWDYVKDVEQIKYKVTPDEIIMGIDYEMKKLVLKDRQVAKQIPLKKIQSIIANFICWVYIQTKKMKHLWKS